MWDHSILRLEMLTFIESNKIKNNLNLKPLDSKTNCTVMTLNRYSYH